MVKCVILLNSLNGHIELFNQFWFNLEVYCMPEEVGKLDEEYIKPLSYQIKRRISHMIKL